MVRLLFTLQESINDNHILASGGGISGLCLAVALSKFPNVDVQVYEAAERFKEIGAGVMIWSRTWRILQLMGLADEFSRIAHSPPDGSIGPFSSMRIYIRTRL